MKRKLKRRSLEARALTRLRQKIKPSAKLYKRRLPVAVEAKPELEAYFAYKRSSLMPQLSRRDWARYETVILARRSGTTFADIGKSLNVTGERARQMWIVATREMMVWRALPHLLPFTSQEVAFWRKRFPPNNPFYDKLLGNALST